MREIILADDAMDDDDGNSDDCHDDIQQNKTHPSSANADDANHNTNEDSTAAAAANTSTIIALCVTMMTHSYLLISVFPYSGYMAMFLLHLNPGNDNNVAVNNATAVVATAGMINDSTAVEDATTKASTYAGIIASAFMIGRACTSYFWGRIADQYGRKFVLVYSLLLSSVFSLLFGFTTNFVAALVVRFLLGCSNGLVSSIKTIVSETCDGNAKVESRNMGLVLGIWGWGFLISPGISGALADPLTQYPDWSWLQQHNTTHQHYLSKFPFLLPNIVACVFTMVSFITVYAFVQETLPPSATAATKTEMKKQYNYSRRTGWVSSVLHRIGGSSLLSKQQQHYKIVPVLKSHDSDVLTPDHNGDDDYEDENDTSTLTKGHHQQQQLSESNTGSDNGDAATTTTTTTIMSLWKQQKVRTYSFIFWGYCFVSIVNDEGFPLFFMSRQAGFGLPEAAIGQLLSSGGLLYGVGQFVVQTFVYRKFGLNGSVRFGSTVSTSVLLLIPVSLLLNSGSSGSGGVNNTVGHLNWLAFAFLSGIIAINRLTSLIYFSNMSVILNRCVSTRERATMNGLTSTGGSIAKGVGPLFAGVLVSFSTSLAGRFGSLIIYGVVGLIGWSVAASTFYFLDDNDDFLAQNGNNGDSNKCCVDLEKLQQQQHATTDEEASDLNTSKRSVIELTKSP